MLTKIHATTDAKVNLTVPVCVRRRVRQTYRAEFRGARDVLPQIQLAHDLLDLSTLRGPHKDFARDILGLRVRGEVSPQTLHLVGQRAAPLEAAGSACFRSRSNERSSFLFRQDI